MSKEMSPPLELVEVLLSVCLLRIDAGVAETSKDRPMGPLAEAEKEWIRATYRPHFLEAMGRDPQRWEREGDWVLRQCAELGRIAGASASRRGESVPSADDVQRAATAVNLDACESAAESERGVWCGTGG